MIELLCAAALLVSLIGTVWCGRKAVQAWREVFASAASIVRSWRADDYRTRNDRVMAERILRTDPPAIDTQPGTDTDLLLDCIAIAGEHRGFEQLREAIHEAREEKP